MSTADGWDLTVPEDPAELLAELRRHGVTPGKRFHVVEAPDQPRAAERGDDDERQRPRRRLRFAGMISAEPDLSENFDRYFAQSYERD